MRFLHWFNLVTWLLLLFTGVGTMKAESFAFITPGVAQKISGLFGGAASLLYFHVAWGMLWILITVPLFLLYKKGGIKAFKEVVITKDDISWLMLKPFHMVGLFTKDLPPQDKYNAGQKLFAISFLIFSSLIMATGLIMAMHIGPTWLIAVSIIVHKLAVAFTLLGIVVHFVMAAIMREERPSLYSMITGYINKAHAQHHFGKWVSEKDSETRDGK
jgi:formate dehydrogenase gamma subunit